MKKLIPPIITSSLLRGADNEVDSASGPPRVNTRHLPREVRRRTMTCDGFRHLLGKRSLNSQICRPRKRPRELRKRKPQCRLSAGPASPFCLTLIIANLFNWNFRPLEVLHRWRDPQLQVGENYSDWTKWRSTNFKSGWLMSLFIFNGFKSWCVMCW